jgi:hypothetical protein
VTPAASPRFRLCCAETILRDPLRRKGLGMGRRLRAQRVAGFVLFDVHYEDGTRSSNRKVPSSELGGLDGDLVVKPYIEAQDRQIAEVSGKPRASIKSVSRSRAG